MHDQRWRQPGPKCRDNPSGMATDHLAGTPSWYPTLPTRGQTISFPNDQPKLSCFVRSKICNDAAARPSLQATPLGSSASTNGPKENIWELQHAAACFSPKWGGGGWDYKCLPACPVTALTHRPTHPPTTAHETLTPNMSFGALGRPAHHRHKALLLILLARFFSVAAFPHKGPCYWRVPYCVQSSVVSSSR